VKISPLGPHPVELPGKLGAFDVKISPLGAKISQLSQLGTHRVELPDKRGAFDAKIGPLSAKISQLSAHRHCFLNGAKPQFGGATVARQHEQTRPLDCSDNCRAPESEVESCILYREALRDVGSLCAARAVAEKTVAEKHSDGLRRLPLAIIDRPPREPDHLGIDRERIHVTLKVPSDRYSTLLPLN
jgi:hypothetical protein